MANPFENFFSKASLRNHLSDSIEVGFNQFGPTLGLSGTLSTTDTVVFVTAISLGVSRLRDGMTFTFPWLAFLPQRFSRSQEMGADLKMPSKFLIAPASPFAYNVLFSDQEQYSVINPFLKFIKLNWEDLTARYPNSADPLERMKHFENYIRQDFIKEGNAKLASFCYWTAGDYSVHIVLLGKDNRILLETRKVFTLGEKDISGFYENCDVIIADICQQPGIRYYTVQAKLKDKK